MPTKTTLISISDLHWIAVLSKLKNALQTTCLIYEHKGPLTYAGFLIMHIENASVFAHFICNGCPYVVLYPVLFLWDHSIQEQRAP